MSPFGIEIYVQNTLKVMIKNEISINNKHEKIFEWCRKLKKWPISSSLMNTLIEVEDLAIESNLDQSRVQILLRFNKIVICETNLNIITEHLFSMSQ